MKAAFLTYLLLTTGVGHSSVVTVAAQALPAASQEAQQPFAGASVILVHAPDKPALALQKMTILFRKAGIATPPAAAASSYVLTGSKAPTNDIGYGYKVTTSPARGGTLLRCTGYYSVGLDAGDTGMTPMQWTTSAKTSAKQCFLLLNQVALAYPGGHVGYSVNR